MSGPAAPSPAAGPVYQYLVVPAYSRADLVAQVRATITTADSTIDEAAIRAEANSPLDPAALVAATLNRYGAQGWRLVAVDPIIAAEPPFLLFEKGPGQ